jgi:chromosome segregation ATPase
VVAAFDTHSSVKRLTAAGMPEAQAEAITELFTAARDAELSGLVTKADLHQEIAAVWTDLQREIASIRADLQHEIGGLRAEIAEVRADLQREIGGVRAEIAEIRADILKWMIGLVAGAVLINVMAVVGAMLAVVRIVGH